MTDETWTDAFITAGGLRTHYLDAPGGDPPIVLLHGLSANAHEFGGLIEAGLSPAFRVIAPDLRGRGASDKPAHGYTMSDHAADVIALLDALGLDRVVLGGHSFGAYLAMFAAVHHPGRIEKLIVIDAAVQLHPRVGEMLKPSLDRLTRVMPSVDAYLEELRGQSYLNGMWDDAIEGYFRAELRVNEDGTAQAATSASAVAEALAGVRNEPWPDLATRVRHPTLLLNATGAYGPPGSPPLVAADNARETANLFQNCRYGEVPGNHLTMVFGEGAAVIRAEIEEFVRRG
ncbi:MAG: alpha/beta hydrolase [Gemmatimonadota bacterium]|nr:alpha/beta hydrolase [Gemmatimonadota bacterium]